MTKYEERLQRIQAAIALEPVDKVPVISGGAAYEAVAAGVKLSDFISDMELNCTAGIKATGLMGNVDGIQAILSSPEGLPAIWLSNIKVPGRELSDDELWQVTETELIKQDDYDKILEMGFESWYQQFMVEKLGNPMEKLKPVQAYSPIAEQRWKDAGYVCIKQNTLMTPFEMLCGGRSLATFLVDDLLDIPEKVDEVFARIHEFNMRRYEDMFRSENKPFGVWVGGWRGTPQTLSPRMFEHFNWPYFKDLVNLAIDYDIVPILHLDACWDNGLHYFREFPKKKCIMALDGKTSMTKAKEAVGDIMCIMGDVPAEMLAFSPKEKVYDYVQNLIKTMGPTGYMICSGCDIPYNAKLENVQMMAKAADDNRFIE